jgi:hypothetical protein
MYSLVYKAKKLPKCQCGIGGVLMKGARPKQIDSGRVIGDPQRAKRSAVPAQDS